MQGYSEREFPHYDTAPAVTGLYGPVRVVMGELTPGVIFSMMAG